MRPQWPRSQRLARELPVRATIVIVALLMPLSISVRADPRGRHACIRQDLAW